VLRRVLLLGGALSSPLYLLAIDVVSPARHPEYHRYTSQMVSELMAVGAPTRPLLVWLFVPYNVLVFALAAGVWLSAGARRSLRLAAAALGAYGVASSAGLLLTPMDLRGTVDSHRDGPHIAMTFVLSICLLASMAFAAISLGRTFKRYTLATIALLIGGGGLAGFLARPMPEATPGVGLAERVNIYATMLWLATFAIALLRRPTPPPTQASSPAETTAISRAAAR